MKSRKGCVYCHELFDPYPALYRRQRACSKSVCQQQRRRASNRRYRDSNPYDGDYRREVKKQWRQKQSRDYMRRYRKNHPNYIKTNRCQQHRRDQKKRNLVKKDVWESLWSGKTVRIRILEESCKERLMRLLPL